MLYKLDFEGHFEYLMQSAEAFKTPNIIFQPYIMFGTKINQHSFWPKKFKLWTLILDWEWITHFCPLWVACNSFSDSILIGGSFKDHTLILSYVDMTMFTV